MNGIGTFGLSLNPNICDYNVPAEGISGPCHLANIIGGLLGGQAISFSHYKSYIVWKLEDEFGTNRYLQMKPNFEQYDSVPEYKFLKYRKTPNIRRTLVGNNIVDHSDELEHRLSALLQLHLHSRLNNWLQGIRQRQPQDSTRIF